MSTAYTDDENFFQAPQSAIGDAALGPADAEIEAIRRQYIGHEVSVKSIGSLFFLGAIFAAVAMIVGLLGMFGVIDMTPRGNDPAVPFGLIILIGGTVAFVIYGGIGYGLRALQPWARWVIIILSGFSLCSQVLQLAGAAIINPAMAPFIIIFSMIPLSIVGYIFYLVASSKGKTVCSREYKEIIRLTPYVKYKTSLLVKILLGFLLFLFIAGLIGGIVGGISR